MGKVIPISPADNERATPLAERSDDELMLLSRGGRREAFGVLIQRHQLRALNLAHKMLGNRQGAKDVVQNAFVDVFRYLPRYQAQGRFPAFFSRFIVWHCHQVWRSARAQSEALAKAESIPAASPDLPDELILQQQRKQQIELAIARLSEPLRMVLVLRYTGDLSYDEIAGVLAIPLGTVKSRLFAALEQMRTILGGSHPNA